MDTPPHPTELLQQSVILFRELADGLCLVPVCLPQLDLVALQLILQMLNVRLQLSHTALPFTLSTFEAPSQLVLLLLQMLSVEEGTGVIFFIRCMHASRNKDRTRSFINIFLERYCCNKVVEKFRKANLDLFSYSYYNSVTHGINYI